jgi:hypothetical protein
VTAKGTRPGDAPSPKTGSNERAHHASTASSRYTPPVPIEAKTSPPWLPVLMLTLLVLGALCIMVRYLFFTDSQIPVVIGLVLILGGLYTATKWR